MRVLQLLASLNPGGIERWLLTMLEGVERSQCQIDVCLHGFRRGVWYPKVVQTGARVFFNPLIPDHVLFGLRLRSILLTGKYDVLQIHSGSYSGFPVWVAKACGVVSILTLHNVTSPGHFLLMRLPLFRNLRSVYSKASVSYALKKSDFVVGVSNGCLDARLYGHEHVRRKSTVIYHGVDIPGKKSKSEKNKFKHQLGWSPDSKVIVTLGRLDPTKNHRRCIDIFIKVFEKVPESRMLLVGDGMERANLESFVRHKGLDDKVAFLGFRDDAADILCCCDVMLMPSLHEGFGIAAIEASAAGMPVVGSRIPGLSEAVEHGVTGFLFEPLDVGSMADALTSLLMDGATRQKMGDAGKQRVMNLFSVDVMIKNYLELYTKCADHSKP